MPMKENGTKLDAKFKLAWDQLHDENATLRLALDNAHKLFGSESDKFAKKLLTIKNEALEKAAEVAENLEPQPNIPIMSEALKVAVIKVAQAIRAMKK